MLMNIYMKQRWSTGLLCGGVACHCMIQPNLCTNWPILNKHGVLWFTVWIWGLGLSSGLGLKINSGLGLRISSGLGLKINLDLGLRMSSGLGLKIS